LRINPAIIAGRIRKEANNYAILVDLVGSGGVRKLFPEVNFGQ
jgi:HTH-type transcriptional regulator/antitoxin HigA